MKSFTGKGSCFLIPMAAKEKMGMPSVILASVLLAVSAGLIPAFSAEQPNPDHWAKVLADGKADTGMRLEAAKRLGEAKNPKYLVVLTEALKDNNKAIRWVAVEVLWDLGDKRAVPALIEYLGRGEGYDWGKILTMNALGSLKDPQAVGPLLKMMENENPFLRRSAALALVQIGDEKAIPGLMGLLKDGEGWLQRLAQDLLVEMAGGKILGEPPRGYEAWAKWYQGQAQHLRIEGVKKE